MCVFLTLRADKAKLEKRFDASYVEEEFFGPTYVQSAFDFPRWPVISSDEPDKIRLMSWGLIPSWIKDGESAVKLRLNTVNARAETIHEKPSFRKAARSQHCLILADGFYEFQEVSGKKYPHFIRLKEDRVFAMAGLFEYWTHPTEKRQIPTFSLITTAANPLMERIHNRKKRMPVILPSSIEKAWLDVMLDTQAMLTSYPEEEMEAWPVSRMITSRGINRNRPEVLQPFDYPELNPSHTLF